MGEKSMAREGSLPVSSLELKRAAVLAVASDSEMRIQPLLLAGVSSQVCTSEAMVADDQVKVVMLLTRVDALADAAKSVPAAPPGVLQLLTPTRLLFHVASPAWAAAPLLPV